MTQAAFDTLSTARRLEREFEFTAKQAEGAATLLYQHLAGTVATRDDMKALDGKIDAGLAALKEDITALDAKIDTGLAALDAKIDAGLAALDGKIDAGLAALREDMKGESKALRGEMKALATKEEMKALATKDELRAQIAEVRTEISRTGNRTIYALGGIIGALFVIDHLLSLSGIGG